ncbi:hypothetical protein F9U64_10560 [Gracilibacillus oryzae]|uniref:Uncharacterized protein n=1 Tax=Gracilibacillus oryzae TaxID=1672701 RepID=A0A7C8KQ65_9BACI|nr:hypothetical protein [Gracilibacillus oryzae]KAB8135712.1 hypothetical protein F9U64_10560 [Gracilibacillus oryzae]
MYTSEYFTELEKSYKLQKAVLYWLLGFIYVAFIGFQLGRIQAIADFNYNLHEIMYLPFSIAIFAVPALFLIYILSLSKYLRLRGRQKPNLRTIAKTFVIIASIVIIFFITEHQFQEVTTGGKFEVTQKQELDGEYYLIIQDKRVKTSFNVFQLIEENQEYLISFSWNKRSPSKGKLERIEHLDKVPDVIKINR